MLKRLLKKLNSTILGGAILISFFTIISKILGLVRDRMLASFFGAGHILDAYFASFRIPDLIFNTLVLGALASAFVPIFVKLHQKDKERAKHVSNSILNILTTVLALIAIVVIIKADFFVKFLVPGFNVEQLALTIQLTRIMLLSIVIFGASNVMSSLLNSYKSYFFYSLAPVAYNLGIILGIILSRYYGYVYLAWGVVFGSVLHFIIQLFAVIKKGWSYSPIFDFKDTYVRKIFKLMLPRTLGLAIMQINQVVITIIASNLVAGSIAVFYFGMNLQSAIVGIFGVSIAIAVFPVLSEHAHNHEKFIDYLVHKIKKIIFLVVPISILMIILRAQIVRIVLGTGSFDWHDTYYTAQVLGYFSISLVFQCLMPLIARAFYALEDTKTPVITSMISFVLNIVLAIYLSRSMGIEGIAIAFSVSSMINLSLLFFILNRKFHQVKKYQLNIFIFKVLTASLLMGVITYLVRHFVSLGVNMDKFIGITLQFLSSFLVGAIVYFILSIIMKIPEVEILKKYYGKFERYLLRKINKSD
jgi:putative peptidoglycan lipid II flippase